VELTNWLIGRPAYRSRGCESIRDHMANPCPKRV